MAKNNKVRFDGNTAAESFRIKGVEILRDKDGQKYEKKVLEQPIIIRKGETVTIDEETLAYLKKNKILMTNAEIKLKKKLIEEKKPLYEMNDEEKTLVLNDRPYEV